MKKQLFIAAIAVGLLSAPTMAETMTHHFQTQNHDIQIQCGGDAPAIFSDSCTYRAWNKPKQIGDGKPDLEITKGTSNLENYFPVKGVRCLIRRFFFHTGNTDIHLTRDYSNSPDCYEKRPGTVGDLSVHIHGNLRSLFRLYEVK
jgi:hypothetical protein